MSTTDWNKIFQPGEIFYLDKRRIELEIFAEHGSNLVRKTFFIKGWGTDVRSVVLIIENVFKKFEAELSQPFFGLTSIPFEEDLVLVLISNTDCEKIIGYVRPTDLQNAVIKKKPGINKNDRNKTDTNKIINI